MRYVCSAAVAVLSVLTPCVMFGQGTQGLSITNYQFVSEQRVTRTTSNVTYRADLINSGPARAAVTATVTSLTSNVQVVAGFGNLHFSPVPANSQVTSSDTFMILVDRSVPFNFSSLQWSFSAPVANAGPNQSVGVGAIATLDGSGSSNPSGIGTLTYNWSFTSRPPGTATVLKFNTSVNPTFLVDIAGTYVVKLTVTNGVGTDIAFVTISTGNSAPVANAGSNQTVALGSTVTLNGSGSSDVNGDPLTYQWLLLSVPSGSTATLSNPTSVNPTFIADKAGAYVAQLIVNDGTVNSNPATVTITTQNTPPVANAGAAQIVNVGAMVQLDGSASTDVDGDPLSYQWTLLSAPASSQATLSNPTAVNPTFTADQPGMYIVQLIVNDGFSNSTPTTVKVTTNSVLPPTANAGNGQTVAHNTTVTLSGSGTDPQSLPITFKWSMMSKPNGSTATLSNSTSTTPTFFADMPGTYVVQLITNNGVLNSSPSTVTITTTNTPPVASAGSAQTVTVGTNVLLDGSGSSDADHDPLTYSWSFTSRPSGSTATLVGPTTKSPMFLADVPGTYVVQLIVNDGFAASSPATVTISAPGITLMPNPLNLLNQPGTLTVNLSSPAGANGQTVNLLSSNTSVATVPQSVFIGQGSSSANVQVTPGSSSGSTVITASANGFSSGTATVNYSTASVSLTVDFANLNPLHITNGSITLSSPAPAAGVVVTLTSSPSGIVDAQPPTVTIASGQTTGVFTVKALVPGSATVTGSAPNYNSGTTTVNVNGSGAITVPATTNLGIGQSAAFQVTLPAAATGSGVTVNLASSNSSIASIPASVLIPTGQTSGSVQVTGAGFGTATITASASGFTSGTGSVTVANTINFTQSTLTVTGTSTSNLTLNLSPAAPAAGLTINLASSNMAVATAPASVTFAANATSATVPVTGVAPGTTTITASATGISSATATVTDASAGAITLPANVTIGLGQSVPFQVTLPTPAPTNGVTVTLQSSNSNTASIPASVFIAEGKTQPTTAPQVTGNAFGTATITATAAGYISGSQAVQVADTISFAQNTLNINGMVTQNLTLNLSAPAPASGLTINISSSNINVATVPATVTFTSGTNSVIVPVTGVAAGSAVITAGAANIANVTASVTVTATASIILPANVTLSPGQTVNFDVQLQTPAPQPVFFTLVSSDPSKLTINPADGNFLIQQGKTRPNTMPKLVGVNFGTVNVSASAFGYTPVSQSVQVIGTLAFLNQNTTITGAVTQNLTLTLSVPAGGGGFTVNLSSDNTAAVTVPATVTFPAGANSVNVPVTGVAPGSAVIHASNLPVAPETTITVTDVSAGAINLPSNVTVGVGQTLPFQVTLGGTAPIATQITLTSSNTSIATVTGSVTVPQGQSTPTVTPQVTGVTFGTVTITASGPGFTTGSQTLIVGDKLTFPNPNATLTGPVTSNVALNLSAPAPAAGFQISLVSSNISVATVPQFVNFPSGATTVNVPVTGAGVGTATITAGMLPNIANVTANITVNAGGAINMPAVSSVGLTQSVNFPITLSTPAPAAFTMTLASDSSNVTISPATVNFAQGATTPTTTPQITGAAFGSANISASAPAYLTVSKSVQVANTISFTQSSITINGTSTSNLTLNLSPAPSSGLVIDLTSSNTSAATVPASVTYGANASVSVPVTGVSVGSSTITATIHILPSATATATATVSGLGSITLPSNFTVGKGQTSNYQVSLSSAAPASGITVNLTSSNTNAVTLSANSVTFTQGQTQATVQVTGVDFGSSTINANTSVYAAASQTVTTADTLSLPATVNITGATTQNVTLTLSAPAPAPNGFTINVTSSNMSVATVPPTVTIAAGATSTTIPVTSLTPGTTTVSSSMSPFIPAASTNVTVVSAGGITIPSGVSIGLGQSSAFQVSLPAPAPAGGVTVNLVSSNSSTVSIASPQSVTFTQGQTQGTIQLTGNAFGSANITASAAGYTSATQSVTVADTISFPATLPISGPTTTNLTLTLSAPAPAAGLNVTIVSSNTSVATVQNGSFAANATTLIVPVVPVGLGTANITATVSGIANPAVSAVTVSSGGVIGLPSGVSLGLGQASAFNVTLPAPAPSTVTVNLASSNSSIVSISPAQVVIAAGQTSPASQPQVTASNTNFGSVNITAQANLYTTGSQSVTVANTIALTPGQTSIIGTNTQNLTLTLSPSPAPANGLTINIVSSNISIATVPATVTIAAGTTTAPVPVTGVAPGVVNITASAPNIANTVSTITVLTAGTITIPTNATVGLGQSTAFNVTLPTGAPHDGFTVNLSSSNTSIATIPSTVTFNQNQTTPVSQPQITGVNIGSANITASAPGYTSNTQAVTVNATVAFSGSTTITGPATQNLTLTLSAASPTAVTINLNSSNTSVATVPATVQFAPNSTTTSVPVTAVGIGSATITANGTNIANATSPITVVTGGAINLGSNLTIGLGQTQSFAVTLPIAAPKNLTVTLASSNTSIATVQNVNFTAGQTTVNAQVIGSNTNFGSVTITASSPVFTNGTVGVTVADTINFPTPTLTISGSTTQNLALNLSAPAPTGGLTVNVTSSNTSIATVPPTVQFPAGQSTVNIPVTGVFAGSSTITAGNPPNIANVTATVTVTSSGNISLPSTMSLGFGLSGNLTVTVSPAPSSNLTVNLASSNSSIASLGAVTSVTVLAGQTTATAQVTGAGFGSATISASAMNYTVGAPTTVTVANTIGFQSNTLSINGTATQNLVLTLSPQAPASPFSLSINLNSSNMAVATVPASVTFPAGATTINVPVTGVAPGTTTITASQTGITSVTATVTDIALGTVSVTPATASVGLGQSGTLTVTLSQQSPSAVTVNLASSNSSIASVQQQVTIPANTSSTTVPVTANNTTFGSATISATATGYNPGATSAVTVANTLSLPATQTISAATNLTLTLSAPAPSTGLVVNVNSSNTSVATVPSTVTIQSGQTTTNVLVTPAAAGTATITASYTGGSTITATSTVTVQNAGTVSLPSSAQLSLGQTATFAVTISPAAPAGGVTVNLASSNTSIATVSAASVFIAQGNTAPAVQPQVTAAGIGSATITANATAQLYGSASMPVSSTGTLAFQSQTITVIGTGTAQGTVKLSSGTAPAGGLPVNLNSSSTGVATVPSSVTISGGQSSANFTVTGVSNGVSTITASGANLVSATALAIDNPASSNGTLTISSATVGQNLQTTVSVSLSVQAPQSGVGVTITSSDPTKLIIAGRQGDVGTGSLGASIPAGLSAIGGIYVQALASSGTVAITASSPGYSTGAAIVTLTPSGFVIAGPGGFGIANFSTNQGLTSTITVAAARLDSSFNYVTTQQIRGGLFVPVSVNSTDSGVGTVSPNPLSFSAGNDVLTTTFTAGAVGSATISVPVPTGFDQLSNPVSFSLPANNSNSVTANVAPAGCAPGDALVTVGNNLETTTRVLLQGGNPNGVNMTITSQSSNLKLATSPTGPFSSSISILIGAGFQGTPPFYVEGLATSGTVQYQATAPGFGTCNGNIALAPSGVVISGPFGVTSHTFQTTTGAPTTDITAFTALLDSGFNYVSVQQAATAVTVNVSSSNTNVGNINPTQIVIPAGGSSAATEFQPAGAGTTTLSLDVPLSTVNPNSSALPSLTATVITPGIAVTNNATIGQNLEIAGNFSLGEAVVNPNGVDVTLSVPAQFQTLLQLANTATAAGSSSIIVHVPSGGTSGSYYIQALGSGGSPTYVASAPGYSNRTGTIKLAPSGAALEGPLGLNVPFAFNQSIASGATVLGVLVGYLDPTQSNAFIADQALRGGLSLTINLNNSNGTAASVTSPVTINGGDSSAAATFTPLAVGSGNASLSTISPSGILTSSPPSGYTRVQYNVPN